MAAVPTVRAGGEAAPTLSGSSCTPAGRSTLTVGTSPLLALLVTGASAPADLLLRDAVPVWGRCRVTVIALLIVRAGMAARLESRPLPPRLLAAAVTAPWARPSPGCLVFSADGSSDALPRGASPSPRRSC